MQWFRRRYVVNTFQPFLFYFRRALLFSFNACYAQWSPMRETVEGQAYLGEIAAEQHCENQDGLLAFDLDSPAIQDVKQAKVASGGMDNSLSCRSDVTSLENRQLEGSYEGGEGIGELHTLVKIAKMHKDEHTFNFTLHSFWQLTEDDVSADRIHVFRRWVAMVNLALASCKLMCNRMTL